jgi:hypothetical protein
VTRSQDSRAAHGCIHCRLKRRLRPTAKQRRRLRGLLRALPEDSVDVLAGTEWLVVLTSELVAGRVGWLSRGPGRVPGLEPQPSLDVDIDQSRAVFRRSVPDYSEVKQLLRAGAAADRHRVAAAG